MLLHNRWWSNLRKRSVLVRRNCPKLLRIWELIWRYHHELLGLILRWWINNSTRVILLATRNDPTRHCRGGNGNSRLDQGNKYLKSIATCCRFYGIQIFLWCTTVTFILIRTSCNSSWIGWMIVPSGSGNRYVFTNIFVQIPTLSSIDKPCVANVINGRQIIAESTGGSRLMRISLLRISLLRFFKTFHKYLPYANFGLFT